MTRIEPERAEHVSGAELIGPVGRAWRPPEARGACSWWAAAWVRRRSYMLCEQLVGAGVRTDVVLGAQTKAALVCRERYEELLATRPARRAAPPTTAASAVRASAPRSLRRRWRRPRRRASPTITLAVCGPEPLMKIVAGMASDAGVSCEVSMEKRMACGVGACLSCVVDTVDGKKRACVDGPVFDARKVVW